MNDRISRAATYWDQNREKARDRRYWMAHPLCRRAINRRVSGDINEWPLEWYGRTRGPAPFEHGVSWGCGLGAFERSAVRCGVAKAIDAFDVSAKSLADARSAAEGEGIAGIHYAIGNFDDPRLASGRYDVVFFHQSLHHVRRLERLFRRVRQALPGGSHIYVDEYVGPSRGDWRLPLLAQAQAFLDSVPDAAKLDRQIRIPIQRDDPSEAIRSGELSSFLRQEADLPQWRPYGGQLTSLVFPNLVGDWTDTAEGEEHVARMLELEDRDLERDPASTFYLVAHGRIRDEPLRVGWMERMRRLRGRARAALGH